MAVRPAPVDLTVMTQNLYVGANTDPVLAAPDLTTAVAAALQAFGQVQANNFPARAGAIASEGGGRSAANRVAGGIRNQRIGPQR